MEHLFKDNSTIIEVIKVDILNELREISQVAPLVEKKLRIAVAMAEMNQLIAAETSVRELLVVLKH